MSFLDHPTVNAARAVAAAGTVLDEGVTSVREVGGLDLNYGRVFAEGRVKGPRVFGAGRILSTTGATVTQVAP